MRCPYCSYMETKVLDTREHTLESTRRRRECLKCEKRFTTYERIEAVPVVVVKKDKRREQFNRIKLLNGIARACEKRPIPREKVEKIVDEIEIELRNKDSTEVPSRDIGQLVMSKLKQIDKIAYIRFASVYEEFATIRSFERVLNNVK